MLASALGEHRPFVANLHGELGDAESWVLTKHALDSILRNEGYKTFISGCLMGFANLFVGISPDDVAVGGHLQAIADLGLTSGNNYWLTNRGSEATDRWAESVGLQVIRYRSDGDDHSEVGEFFDDLLGFVPPELSGPFSVPTVDRPSESALDELPDPDEMRLLDAEETRQLLNTRARKLLNAAGEGDEEEYKQFLDEYDEAIYRAWYVTAAPPRNVLHGYELESEAGRGSFARVFSALSPAGDRVAVKLMHEDIRNKPDLQQGFRRGVRSMRILAERGVEGMVPYIEASEIPAFVSMEWVEGPSLREA